MSLGSQNGRQVFRFAFPGFLMLMFALLIALGPQLGTAQDAKKVSGQPNNAELVARGKYIVEDVAMCGTCHTPRKPDGQLDYSQWLLGGSVPYLPAQPNPNWPIIAPRIGGLLPTSSADMVKLLTTAIWINGEPLRDPMPKFHMTRSDAEAVVAYLKSLSSAR